MLNGDVEFFNGFRWKPIKEFQVGHKVLQYDENGCATLVRPTEFKKWNGAEVFYNLLVQHCNTQFGSDLCTIVPMLESCCSGKHKIVLTHKSSGKIIRPYQSEYYNHREKYKDFSIPMAFMYNGYLDLPMDILDDIVDTVKTGTVHEDSGEFVDTSQTGDYCFKDNLCCLSSEAKKYLLGKELVFSEECVENNQFLEFACRSVRWLMAGGYDPSSSEIKDLFNCGDIYTYEVKELKEGYSFSVPSSMIVARYKGHVFITGDH